MSGTIKTTVRVEVLNGSFKDSFTPQTYTLTQAAIGANRPVVTVNASAYEAVPMGDVTVPGVCCGVNTSTANFVRIGMSTASGSTAVTPFGKLRPGLPFTVPLSSGVDGTLKWKADTAACKVDLRVYQV